jgi:hypothetical protein
MPAAKLVDGSQGLPPMITSFRFIIAGRHAPNVAIWLETSAPISTDMFRALDERLRGH